jgi:hypothetical protein
MNHPDKSEKPAVAVSLQLVTRLPATTVRPLGNESMNRPVKLAGVSPELLKVMVRVETPPALIVAGLKVLPRVTDEPPHTGALMVFESSVTAPFRARALPDSVAPVVRAMLVSATIFPTNEVVVPRVAELPTCQ